ncbi:MAG: hypothetical protein V7785_00730 [Bermanella sp.]
MFRAPSEFVFLPAFLLSASLCYANDQAPELNRHVLEVTGLEPASLQSTGLEANKLEPNSDYFLVTDPIGMAFGVNTLGLGIRLEQGDITLAYSYLDTDIPDQDDLKGSAMGMRWNYYLDNLDVAPYVGMVVSYADVDEDDGQTIENNQYVGAALLGGYQWNTQPLFINAGLVLALGNDSEVSLGPELALGYRF